MSRVGVTFDTGALIALEANSRRMRDVLSRARSARQIVRVPIVVVIEWWRGTYLHRDILQRLEIDPTTELIAKAAGEALAKLPGTTPIDAAVMASAALRGDVVYTSDTDDFERLHTHFRGVRAVVRAS